MDAYKLLNIEKYREGHERQDYFVHPSKIIGLEYFARNCARLASSNEVVLDIGGGTGVWTQILRQNVVSLKVHAIDISFSTLRERPKDDVCVCGDMEKLPFKDGSFDRALFFASIHHVRNTPGALEEANRVIRPGGYIVLQEPISLRLLLLRREIEPVDDVEFCFSLRYLLKVLNQAGLQVVYCVCQGLFQRVVLGRPSLGMLRFGHRLDELLSAVPVLRSIGSFGNKVTIVAQKPPIDTNHTPKLKCPRGEPIGYELSNR